MGSVSEVLATSVYLEGGAEDWFIGMLTFSGSSQR